MSTHLHRAVRLFSLMVVSGLLVACSLTGSGGDPIGPDVDLAADSDTLRPGETVQLTLSNGTDKTVSYNLCWSILESRTDKGWTEVELGRACTAEALSIEPGGSATYDLDLPDDVSSRGVHRFKTTVTVGIDEDKQERTLYTDTFSIVSAE
jgi:hypothetical protein